LEVDPQFQQNPDSLKNIYVASASNVQASSGSTTNITNNAQTSVSTTPNTQVPLSAFTRFEPGATALALNHQGQFPVVTISFNLLPGGPVEM
jgi:multidrug efflux pump